MPTGILTAIACSAAMQVGLPAPMEYPNFPALPTAYSQHGFEGQYEQRHPFDTQQNWVHGYFQEIPAYGGHVFYRPYNYKDVLSQSQTAAGWGLSPTMPYSQQFWHRYHDQATMLKLSQRGDTASPAGVVTAPWTFTQPPGQAGWVPMTTNGFGPAPSPYLPATLTRTDPTIPPPTSGFVPKSSRY